MPNEDQKLDNLRPGSREMEEGGRWEGQNFHQLKKVQRMEAEEEEEEEEYLGRGRTVWHRGGGVPLKPVYAVMEKILLVFLSLVSLGFARAPAKLMVGVH